MYKIGVISDTHGLLRDEVVAQLEGCQLILHAGDINKPEILMSLMQIAPLKVVRGNNDKGEWAEALPEQLRFTVEGKNFFMVHNKKDFIKDRTGIDVMICGHSHKYSCNLEGETYVLNPGSCGKRRFDLAVTMAILTIDQGQIEITQIDLPH